MFENSPTEYLTYKLKHERSEGLVENKKSNQVTPNKHQRRARRGLSLVSSVQVKWRNALKVRTCPSVDHSRETLFVRPRIVVVRI